MRNYVFAFIRNFPMGIQFIATYKTALFCICVQWKVRFVFYYCYRLRSGRCLAGEEVWGRRELELASVLRQWIRSLFFSSSHSPSPRHTLSWILNASPKFSCCYYKIIDKTSSRLCATHKWRNVHQILKIEKTINSRAHCVWSWEWRLGAK